MAIEREIPKDISKYEAKLIGPFTTRQVVCGVPGIGLALGSYFLLRPYISEDMCFFIALLVSLPLLLCAVAKPYGIPFEKYISIIFVSQVLAPKYRKYVTENTYKELEEIKTNNKKKKKKEKKKNKNIYVGEYQQFK